MVNKYVLLQEFFDFRMFFKDDITTNIAKIESLVQRLKNMGETITESQVMTKIICSLPPSFRHIVAAWDNVPEDLQTLNNLTARLLKEETLNKSRGNPEEFLDQAFYSTSSKPFNKGPKVPFHPLGDSVSQTPNRDHSQQQKSKFKDKKSCRYCHKVGHDIAHCFKLQNKNKHQPPNGPSSINKLDNNNKSNVLFTQTYSVNDSGFSTSISDEV